MAFRTTTIHECTDCGAKFTDNSWHNHDCRSEDQKLQDKCDQETWDENFEYWENWQEEHGINHATMSCYEHKAHDRAVEGKCVLIHRDYYEGGKPYVSRVLNNPTWGTVLKHFDRAIPVTGDYHHCFLEGIGQIDSPEGYVLDLPNDCKVFVFHTGS